MRSVYVCTERDKHRFFACKTKLRYHGLPRDSVSVATLRGDSKAVLQISSANLHQAKVALIEQQTKLSGLRYEVQLLKQLRCVMDCILCSRMLQLLLLCLLSWVTIV